MKLFTKDINQKLFAQYRIGSNLNKQKVVAKIFNPYGEGRWYLLNSDPNDPDYLWAIVQMGDNVEIGSVSRSELERARIKPFGLPLERDTYFSDRVAIEVLEGLEKGQTFAAGGMTAGRWYKDNSGKEFRFIGESEGKLLFKDGEKIITKSEEDFEDAPKEKKLFGIFADGGKIVGYEVEYEKLVGGERERDIKSFKTKEEAEEFAKENYGYVENVYEGQYEFAKGGETKVPKFKIGDMVYSYQNTNYAAPINAISSSYITQRSGVTNYYVKQYRYQLSLKHGNSFPWISEKALYKTKQLQYDEDEDESRIEYMKGFDKGGETEDEGVDLFEDYDDIPKNVQKILEKYDFEEGDYRTLEKAKKDVEKVGYTFEYSLDGTAYDLRKIGEKGKSGDEYAKGGETFKKEKFVSTPIKEGDIFYDKPNAKSGYYNYRLVKKINGATTTVVIADTFAGRTEQKGAPYEEKTSYVQKIVDDANEEIFNKEQKIKEDVYTLGKKIGLYKLKGGNLMLPKVRSELYSVLKKLADNVGNVKDSSVGAAPNSMIFSASQSGNAISVSTNNVQRGGNYSGDTYYLVQVKIGGALPSDKKNALKIILNSILSKFEYTDGLGTSRVRDTDGTNWSSVMLTAPTKDGYHSTFNALDELKSIRSLKDGGKMADGGIVTLYDDYDKDAGYIIEKGNKYWTGKNWSDVKAYAESYKTKQEAEKKLKSIKMAKGGLVKINISDIEDSDFQSLSQIFESNDAAFSIDEAEEYVSMDLKGLPDGNEKQEALEIIGKYNVQRMDKGGKINWGEDLGDGFSIGNDVYIKDSSSRFYNKNGYLVGKIGQRLVVQVGEDDMYAVVSKEKVEKLNAPMAKGGNINSDLSDKELKDLVERLSKEKTLDKKEEYALMKAKYMLEKRDSSNKMANGGSTPRTIKLTLSDKDSYDYTYKQDGATASITFGFGKEPFQYEVKKISKSLEPLKQDILDAFTIQGIKQHEYKGGFSEAIKHLDTKVVYEDNFAKGGMVEHGLKIGDKITTDMFWDNQIVVENQKTKKRAQINLETGVRKEEMAEGGQIEVGDKIKSKSGISGIVYESSGGNFKLKDEYGNKNNKYFFAKDFKKSEIIKANKMADGGDTAAAEHNIKQAKYGARLVGKQKNLDVNKNGKLDAEDFKMLRKSKMAMGGKVKFEDKVKAVKESLLKRKKVSPKVQKDYGKTYDRKEALEAAKRIVGAQTAKYELKKKFKKGGKTIAQTPAPKKDRVFGSSKNKAGSASSKKAASNIELNESIVKTLGEKAKKYNEKHSSKVSTSTLKAVMRRGMGAYSTSHRPTITGGAPNSRQAWGFARVNKFLLKKGGTKVKAAYVQDDDLL